jgi:hypothetical protein
MAETVDLALGGIMLSATVGFDAAGNPAEVFLSGAKDGSGMASILEDASVVISIALQHGIPASALAKSVARAPHHTGCTSAVSVIGAALDLLVGYEGEFRERLSTQRDSELPG